MPLFPVYHGYRFYQNKTVAPRSKAEEFAISEMSKYGNLPTKMDIHAVTKQLIDTLNNCSDPLVQKGVKGITFSKVHMCSCIAGKEHIQAFTFSVYGPRRGTYSCSLSTTVMYNTNENCSIEYQFEHNMRSYGYNSQALKEIAAALNVPVEQILTTDKPAPKTV